MGNYTLDRGVVCSMESQKSSRRAPKAAPQWIVDGAIKEPRAKNAKILEEEKSE